jgi:serine/threonine protein kinase
MASNAFHIESQIKLIDGNCYPEFDGWLVLRRSGIITEFRRIQRVGFGLLCLDEYVFKYSIFEERSMIRKCDEIGNKIYQRIEDGFFIVVKTIRFLESVSQSRFGQEIENFINLHHPCIATPIGFIFGIGSGIEQELKIIRIYSEGCSLFEILSVNPDWLTSTVKMKVIVGIVLGLRFTHSFGLFHGHLSAKNIVFDSDHCIQIVGFNPKFSEMSEGEGEGEGKEAIQLKSFSGKGWTDQTDIHAFASILFEIVVGGSAKDETSIPAWIPPFVSKIIELKFMSPSETRCSFHDFHDPSK